MEAYLVQHGEANNDEEKALSDKGKTEVARMASALVRSGVKVSYIMHSNKLRAKQTADYLSSFLKPKEEREMLGLAPTDNPKMALEFLGSAREPVMIVGHLPHLSKLASMMLGSAPETELVKFRMAGVVCFTKEERWKVKWMLTPEIV